MEGSDHGLHPGGKEQLSAISVRPPGRHDGHCVPVHCVPQQGQWQVSAGAPRMTHEEEKAERGSTRCPGWQITGHGAEVEHESRSRRADGEPACSSPPLRSL